MLTIKERQTILKRISLYNGKIDGKEGPITKKAYKLLQQKFFKRQIDIDGIYGKNTDVLLTNVKNFLNSKYFKLEEFRCHCNIYCTGYPGIIDYNLINNLNVLRESYGPIIITSGLRCIKYNKNINGSVNSKHLIGKASDIKNTKLKNLESRKKFISKWLNLNNSDMAYCNGFMKYKNGKESVYWSNTMGSSIHLQTK